MQATEDVEIRPARPADAAALAALANALDRDRGGGGNVHSAESVLRAAFGDEPVVRFMLASAAGEAVGYAMFSRFYNSDTAQTGSYLHDLYVAPSLQRAGVGRQLMAAVARETATDGGCFIATGIHSANAAGRIFYATLGARDDDVRLVEIDGKALDRLAADGGGE